MNSLPEKEFITIVAGGVALAANAGFINVVSMAGVFPGIVSFFFFFFLTVKK